MCQNYAQQPHAHKAFQPPEKRKEEKKKKKRFAQRQLKGFPQDMRLRRAPAGGKYTRREGPCFKFPYTLPHRTAKRHFQ